MKLVCLAESQFSAFRKSILEEETLDVIFEVHHWKESESFMAFANCRQRTQHHSQASSLLNGSQLVS